MVAVTAEQLRQADRLFDQRDAAAWDRFQREEITFPRTARRRYDQDLRLAAAAHRTVYEANQQENPKHEHRSARPHHRPYRRART